MKQTRLIMGMPITIWIVSRHSQCERIIDEAFALFTDVDTTFSTYKPDSQISLINNGNLTVDEASTEVQTVIKSCSELQARTLGYFDIHYKAGQIDPSGYVKGWAIQRVCNLLDGYGLSNYCVDAGGDVMLRGVGEDDGPGWLTGIASPFDATKVVKTLRLKDMAIATSGAYIRGQHILNPHTGRSATQLASVSVIGPDICMSDVLATAVFAMGLDYERLLSQVLPAGYDAYIIDSQKRANFTAGLERYAVA